jgi:CheY-like chemotaxis protein
MWFSWVSTNITLFVFVALTRKADISMPVMDGMASAREIRKYERSRGQKPCTIIALTGLGSADSQQDAFSSGMDRFLTKPVRLSHLRDILNDWAPDLLPGGLLV